VVRRLTVSTRRAAITVVVNKATRAYRHTAHVRTLPVHYTLPATQFDSRY